MALLGICFLVCFVDSHVIEALLESIDHETSHIWMNPGIVSDARLSELRSSGYSVIVFLSEKSASADIESISYDMKTHHPEYTIMIESVINLELSN